MGIARSERPGALFDASYKGDRVGKRQLAGQAINPFARSYCYRK